MPRLCWLRAQVEPAPEMTTPSAPPPPHGEEARHDVIEGLLAERTRAGRKQFQVRWRGESPDSWVDAEAVHDQGLIADLRSRLRAAPTFA